MTLDDARRVVRSWWIRSIEGRIERASYVTLEDVVDIVFAERDELYLLGGYDAVYNIDNLRALTAGPLIAVEVSQRGMDLLGHERFGNADEANQCLPAPHAKRDTYHAFWDARRGLYLGHQFGALPEALWQRAAEDPPPVVPVTATPRPTPSPGRPSMPPTPTPAVRFTDGHGQVLGEGEVPQAVLAVADVVPWVRGAQWTYRVTQVSDGVRWATGTLTETVREAARLAPDMMAVSLGWRASPESLSSLIWGSGMGWPLSDAKLILFLPGAVMTAHPSQEWPQALDAFRTDAAGLQERRRTWERGDPVALVQLPLRVKSRYNYWWRVDQQENVSVPAGTFKGCYALVEVVNAGNTWAHWLCPGVGFVRHELPRCSTLYGGYEVLELEQYRIPSLVAVP